MLRWVEEMPAFTDNVGILSFATEISGCVAAQFEGEKKKKKGGCATEHAEIIEKRRWAFCLLQRWPVQATQHALHLMDSQSLQS